MQVIEAPATPERFAPLAWPWALAEPPALSNEKTPWRGALIRRWSGTSPVMVQPPLDHHYVVMHLGGSKRVHRRRDGPPLTTLADCGSLTLVPAGTSYVWKTEGPISFAHLYLHPQQLLASAEGSAETASGDAPLIDRVACRDPLLEPLFCRMLAEIQAAGEPSRLLLDSLLESFCIRLANKHVAAARERSSRAVSLAPHRLRRVLDFIDANLGGDVALADLVAAAGNSQFHFSRAFHMATGLSPYRYVSVRRVEYARVLLLASDASLTEIGATCGFTSKRQFSVLFKQIAGVGPKRFRLLHERRACD